MGEDFPDVAGHREPTRANETAFPSSILAIASLTLSAHRRALDRRADIVAGGDASARMPQEIPYRVIRKAHVRRDASKCPARIM
jgi:hypothetical protein